MSTFSADTFTIDLPRKSGKKVWKFIIEYKWKYVFSTDVREEDMNKGIQIIFAVE